MNGAKRRIDPFHQKATRTLRNKRRPAANRFHTFQQMCDKLVCARRHPVQLGHAPNIIKDIQQTRRLEIDSKREHNAVKSQNLSNRVVGQAHRDCRTLHKVGKLGKKQLMAERLVNVDRQTPMLLPPDLREWVADNELAHLILEAVELCDMSGAQLNVRGSGSEQYPPSMMMALLVYAYATGVFSSRRIERASYDSVAVRYICANHHPDHDTIAKFRRENQALFRSCFGQVLLLAREAGVLRVGALSLDGTRIAGAGRALAVRSLEQIERELQAVGQELLEKAEAADAKDYDAEGTQLPEGLREQKQRKEKLLAAKAAIEARRQGARESGRRDQPGSGHHTKSASITEPETRCLRRGSGPAIQGYNAQAVVDAGSSGLIVGTHLSDALTTFMNSSQE